MKKLLLLLSVLVLAPLAKAQTVSDPFTTSGVIGAPNWTTGSCSAGSYTTLSSNGSGLVQATAATTQGIIVYTSMAFTSNQGSQVLIPSGFGRTSGTTGAIVNMDTSCNGYIWLYANNNIISIQNGAYSANSSSVCPNVNAGDSPEFFRSGNDLHCKNGATDVNAWTTTQWMAGTPGLIVDNRASTLPGLGAFTGTGAILPFAAIPTASPTPGFYSTTQTVTLGCTTPSSTILYGLNGAPVTTTYTTALTVSATSTIATKCTATGYSDSTVATFGYHIGGGNLSKITLYPPSDGYHITTNTGTVQLVPVCSYSNGFPDDNCASSGYPLTWGGSDDTVFTVNPTTGLATGSGPGADFGSASVYATYNNLQGNHIVNMDTSAPTQLTSRPEGTDSEVVVGSTVLVSAIDSTFSTVNGPGVGNFAAYTTSNAGVATVNNVGEVKGISAGTATITATYYGQTVGRTINVTNPTTTSTTYYVRPGGGDRSQCTGLANVDYPGSGTGVACAVSNPMYLFTDESSSTIYTGLLHAGDTGIIGDSPTPYRMGTKASGVAWITNDGNFILPPSGLTSQHTKLLGQHFASCTSPRYGPGNRAPVWAYHVGWLFDLKGVQNFDLGCINDESYQDCNPGLTGDMTFACPAGGGTQYGTMVNNFTANVNITDVRFNGMQTALVGTSGPGLVLTRVQSEGMYLAGWNYDNPFGFSGNRQDTIVQNYVDTSFAGFTSDLLHSISAASIDGAGHLNVTFSSVLNYVPGTMLVLTGMTPSQFNGTFPVTAVTFNQQTATITGGSCDLIGSSQGGVSYCIFNTSAPPAFGIGAFVQLTGVTPSALNGTYEVWNVAGSTFQINASSYTRPGWPLTPTSVSSGGTASTANTLTATLAGSASTATVLGLAGHVYNFHRAMDQGDGGSSNGDCDGSGAETIGDSLFDHVNVFSCTQDGVDQLHASMNKSHMTNSTAINTSGAGFKFGNAADILFENNLIKTPCAWTRAFDPSLPPEWNQYPALPCRAGAATGMESRVWTTAKVDNNTWTTSFGIAVNAKCDDTNGCNILSPLLFPAVWQNNLVNGFTDTNDPAYNGQYATPWYQGNANSPPPWTFINNMGYHTNGGPGGGSNNYIAANSFTLPIADITSIAGESNQLNFNAQITTGSAAAGFGVHNSYTPVADINGVTRPNPPATGAYDLAGGPPVLVSMAVGNVSMAIAGTATPNCVATYSDSSTGACVSPVWASASPSIATINSSTGLVTGVSPGTSNITATIGAVTSSPGTATVNPPTLVSMAVSSVSMVAGSSATPTCTATYSDSSTGACSGPVWHSASPLVATVNSSSGLVTGVSAGTSAITTTIGAVTSSPGTATVTATPPPTLVAMTVSGVSLVVGGTATPSCTATMSDGTHPSCSSPVWHSGSTGVATINSSTGLVTGVSVGSSPITTTIGAVTSSPGTAIVSAAPPPASMTIIINGRVIFSGQVKLQ